jgi:hypothetical protein
LGRVKSGYLVKIPVQPGDFADARHNEVAFPFHAGYSGEV